MNAETTDLKKCHSEPFAFVIPNEVRNLLLLRAGSVRNLTRRVILNEVKNLIEFLRLRSGQASGFALRMTAMLSSVSICEICGFIRFLFMYRKL